MDDPKSEYLKSYEDWQEQLQELHLVLLDGKAKDPPSPKDLLNREVRAKERYNRSRHRLLGLPGRIIPLMISKPYPLRPPSVLLHRLDVWLCGQIRYPVHSRSHRAFL